MKEITKAVMEVHNLECYDYMGYDITDEMQYHHIRKRCKGGDYSLRNGAALNQYSHPYLHLIEEKNKYDFNQINGVFAFINKNHDEIDIREWGYIRDILDDFEIEWLGKENKKGELYIKDEYLVRPDLEEIQQYTRRRKC